jgi:hypothetical protein
MSKNIEYSGAQIASGRSDCFHRLIDSEECIEVKHRFIWITVLLLALSAFAVSAQDSDMTTYVTEDGLIAVSHPEGWSATTLVFPGFPTFVMVANSETALQNALTESPQPGDVSVWTGLLSEVQLIQMGLADDAAPDELIRFVFYDFFGAAAEVEETNATAEEPQIVALDEQREAGVLTFSADPGDGYNIAFELEEGVIVYGFSLVATGEMTEATQEQILDILATVEFSGTPEDLIPTPVAETTGETADAVLLVSSAGANRILQYDAATGEFEREFSQTVIGNNVEGDPQETTIYGLTVGPDGELYTSISGFGGVVVRYDLPSGALMDVFAGGGGMAYPDHLAFGPDGHLYVTLWEAGRIDRYDGTTGIPLGTFTDAAYGGFAFQGDYMYAINPSTNQVLRLDPQTGDVIDVFIEGGSDVSLVQMTFGPDGDLYVSDSFVGNQVLRYDGNTGELIDTLNSDELAEPWGLTFGPDGHLYVASFGNDQIVRFDGETGEFLDVFVSAGSGGLSRPTELTFVEMEGQ